MLQICAFWSLFAMATSFGMVYDAVQALGGMLMHAAVLFHHCFMVMLQV